MPRLAAAALTLAAAALLLALRAVEQTPDALDQALAARTGAGMLHPHHLIYAPLVHLTLRALAALGGDPRDAVMAGQLHNAAWAAVALPVFAAAAARLLGSAAAGVLLAIVLLVTRGFWTYASQVESYLPAAACLILLAARATAVPPGKAAPSWPGLAALLALAALLHQTNVLFAVPLAVGLSAAHGRPGALAAARACAAAGALLLAAYAAAYVAAAEAAAHGGFQRYVLAYALAPVPGWGEAANMSARGLAALLRSQAAAVTAYPAGWGGAAAVLGGAAAAGLLVWHLRQIQRRAPEAARRAFLLAWVGVYWLFFLWWLPGDSDFFVVTLPPLLLLAGLVWRDLRGSDPSRRRRVGRAGAALALGAALLIGTATLAGTVWPRHRGPGAAHAEAAALAAATPPGCALGVGYAVQQNLRYHFDRADALHLDEARLACARGVEPPPRLARLRQGCAAVPLADVLACLPAAQGAAAGAAEARALAAWLFGVEAGDLDAAPSPRPIALLTLPDAQPYLLLDGGGADARAPGDLPLLRQLELLRDESAEAAAATAARAARPR